MKTKLLKVSKIEAWGSEGKTFCEFFSGIGLVREGLEASGWKCVYANDIAAKKQKAYEARFGKSEHFHLGDVGDTAEVLSRVKGKPFLATASFPCIDLSLAGHYRGLEGVYSSTFFGFANAIEAMGERKPSVIMLENVKGFLTSRKGQDFATIVRRIAELGYWLDAIILDACHFTPQSRPRVFVIGMTTELRPTEKAESGYLWPVELPSKLRPEVIVHFKNSLDLPTGWVTLPIPVPPQLTIKLSDVLEIDDEQEWWDDPDVERHYRMMSDLHRGKIDALAASGQQWVGTIFRRVRNGEQRAEVRFDGLAGCLRTPKGGSAKQIVIATNAGKLRMRWMSPREYGKLQGVPDFPLVGNTIQQLWGFADAVCIPAIRWIDLHVLSPIYESASRAGGNGNARQSHS